MIEIGALLSTLICAEVGEKFGFQYGFALAGFGMIIGVVTFFFGRKNVVRMRPRPYGCF